ncbi:unnamed protein product [Spirodela intermedia]|uniref:DYW domain-containing protein n=1 Tax=Spirodela intermedia TaxID=51605 RepID=A0A7I8LBC4_SPIIN|nr:unnamed protein product [Spirodela intermedia]
MVGGSVLPQTTRLLTPNNHGQGSEQRQHGQQGGHLPPPPPLLQSRWRSLEEFRQAHAQFIKLGQDCDPRCASSLITSCALSEWGSMEYAVSIFRRAAAPTTYDVNTLVRGHVLAGDPLAAVLLYKEMEEEGGFQADNFTFTFLLKACSRLAAAGEGQQLLISLYGRCGEVALAGAVFERMGTQRNAASWSALMAALTRAGRWAECLALYGRMKSEGCRAEESALGSVLVAAAHLGALEIGRRAHGCLLRSAAGWSSVIVQTSLIDMYMKCGNSERGMRVFGAMEEKNLWTYSAVISGLALHGDGEGALRVFAGMLTEGLRPDGAVYVGVLTACARRGMLAEGRRCFEMMRREHGVAATKQHYACMVDLLARAGKVEEAHELVLEMPEEPHDVVWRCLLSACRVHGKAGLGELAARKLMEMATGNAGDYLLLSNMYARAGRWEEAAAVRTAMVDGGLPQAAGTSAVEAAGTLHSFVSQDRSHPQNRRIYEMLRQVEWQLRFEGYSPDTSQSAVVDGDEEEKRRLLAGHSQKLAIAFGLISTHHGSPIRIVRNLRMCGDCHTYSKLVSKVFDWELVVREPGRFHRFKEGTCSCGDYW